MEWERFGKKKIYLKRYASSSVSENQIETCYQKIIERQGWKTGSIHNQVIWWRNSEDWDEKI